MTLRSITCTNESRPDARVQHDDTPCMSCSKHFAQGCLIRGICGVLQHFSLTSWNAGHLHARPTPLIPLQQHHCTFRTLLLHTHAPHDTSCLPSHHHLVDHFCKVTCDNPCTNMKLFGNGAHHRHSCASCKPCRSMLLQLWQSPKRDAAW